MAPNIMKARNDWMREARAIYNDCGDSRQVRIAVARGRIAHARVMGFDAGPAMRAFSAAIKR